MTPRQKLLLKKKILQLVKTGRAQTTILISSIIRRENPNLNLSDSEVRTAIWNFLVAPGILELNMERKLIIRKK